MAASSEVDTSITPVRSGGHEYGLILPNRGTDYIQAEIASTNRPYEEEMLAAMAGRLAPGDTVLDLGANVGNHTLYLACVVGCRVIAFEPDTDLAAAIERAVRLNNVADRVRVESVALGAEPAQGWLVNDDPTNLGAQHVTRIDGDKADGRPVAIVPLDTAVDEPVAAIKIDVEGAELDVLRGATELIKRFRPDLYVECLTYPDYEAVDDLLAAFGYVYRYTYNPSPTHLFVAREKELDDDARSSIRAAVLRGYEVRDIHLSTRDALLEANAQYRRAIEQTQELRVTAERTRDQYRGAIEQTQELRVTAERTRDQYRGAIEQTQELRVAAERNRAEKDELLVHLAYTQAEIFRMQAREAGMRADLQTLRGTIEETRLELQASSAQIEREVGRRDAADQALRNLRASPTFRIGRALANARNFSGFVRLPTDLVGVWKSLRRRQ